MDVIGSLESGVGEFISLVAAFSFIVFTIQIIGPIFSGDYATVTELAANKMVSSILIGSFISIIITVLSSFRSH